MSEKSGGTLVLFWLPIILALIALLGQAVAIYKPDVLSSIAPDPSEPTVTDEPTTTSPQPTAGQIQDNDCVLIPQADPEETPIQFCWGRSDLNVSDGPSHVRGFDFRFPEAFAGEPIITTSINVQSSGYAYAVYNYNLTEANYNGWIVEVEYKKNDAPVSMNYVAIGRPASQ